MVPLPDENRLKSALRKVGWSEEEANSALSVFRQKTGIPAKVQNDVFKKPHAELSQTKTEPETILKQEPNEKFPALEKFPDFLINDVVIPVAVPEENNATGASGDVSDDYSPRKSEERPAPRLAPSYDRAKAAPQPATAPRIEPDTANRPALPQTSFYGRVAEAEKPLREIPKRQTENLPPETRRRPEPVRPFIPKADDSLKNKPKENVAKPPKPPVHPPDSSVLQKKESIAKNPFNFQEEEVKRRSKKKHVFLKISIAFFILAFLSGGTAYALYFYRIGPFNKPPVSGQEVANLFSEQMVGLENLSYDFNLRLSSSMTGEPNLPKAVGVNDGDKIPLFSGFLSLIFSLDGKNASVNFSGSGERKTTSGKENEKIAGKASVTTGDSLYVFEGEYFFGELGQFVKLDKFPLSFLDIEPISGQWVKFTPAELSDRRKYLPIPEALSEEDISSVANMGVFLEAVLTSAARSQYLTSSKDPVKESLNGKVAYKYELAFDAEKANAFRIVLLEELGKKPELSNFIPSVQSDRFNSLASDFARKATIVLRLSSRGAPLSVEIQGALFPPIDNDSWRGRELSVYLKTDFSGSSEEFEVPRQFDSLEDAVLKISSLSRDSFLLEKQIENVKEIREAVRIYRELSGEFPKELKDLSLTASEIVSVKNLNPNVLEKTLGLEYKSKPILSTIPNDAYTGQQYVYVRLPEDYGLRYEAKLPPYGEEGHVAAYYSLEYVRSNPVVVWVYARGTNTANAGFLSVEAREESAKDSDKDGLPDSLEEYIGTSPLKSDSNGDGTSDLQAFLNE